MSPKERAIAQAAIRPYEAKHYLDLHSQVAARTDCPLQEVEEVINALIVDDTLRARTEPMLNLRSQPIMEAWYEKGDNWMSQTKVPHKTEADERNDPVESAKSEDLDRSQRLRDQIRGETTEHALPSRLEDEGQSGG